MSHHTNMERFEELMADRALFGLDSAEINELQNLTSGKTEDLSFELSAAAADLSFTVTEPMPVGLHSKILADAEAALAPADDADSEGGYGSDHSVGIGHAVAQATSQRWSAGDESAVMQSPAAPFHYRELIAWGSAAAVGFVAFFLWSSAQSSREDLNSQLADLTTRAQLFELELTDAQKEAARIERKKNEILIQLKIAEGIADKNQLLVEKLESDKKSLLDESERLLAENASLQKQISPDGSELYQQVAGRDGVLRWKWKPTDDSDAEGDVVWDPEAQQGAMRFVNLAKNDPTESQYQLWIIEADGREQPVDGGVFNIEKEGGEVFVPINAKLVAGAPAAFAITVEQPNGVVVSDRKRLPLLAQAPAED